MNENIVSDKLFSTIMEFKEYCESQGATEWWPTIVEEILSSIKIAYDAVKDKWPTVHEIMGPGFIMTVFGAEQIIDRGLVDGMRRKKYYKEIYKDVRAKVELFVELHGKSEVISKQLAIE